MLRRNTNERTFINKTSLLSPDEFTLRKLRKKLRQIENLQQLNRVLSEEERIKIASQDEIRKQIQELISKHKNVNDEAVGSEKQPLLIDFNSTLEHQTPLIDDCATNNKVTNSSSKLLQEPKLEKNPTEEAADLTCGEIENSEGINDESVKFDWKNEIFCVSNLSGHNDIIYCVDADDNYVITCSRDTTVKVWDAETGEEISSLRGHTAAVTSVILLPKETEEIIIYKLRMLRSPRLAVSGGHDCMIFIWSILEEMFIHSVYTYNAITCLGLFEKENYLLSGTDGGKLELWKLPFLEDLNSLLTYDDSISQIKIEDNHAFISSSEGIISIIELRDEEMHCIFSSECVLSRYNHMLTQRCTRSLDVFQNNIYYGDDGINVKVINWKIGSARKLTNHLNRFGMTGAIKKIGRDIIFSSYNIDTGESCLNIYTLLENQYIASLNIEGKERVLALACTKTAKGTLRIVTAGTKLKIWDSVGTDQTNLEMSGKQPVKAIYIPQLATNAVDSEVDSIEDSSDDSEADDVEQGRFPVIYTPENMDRKARHSIWLWCNIL